MKNIFLFLLFGVLTLNINAQSDATWEETIGFLNKHQSSFYKIGYRDRDVGTKVHKFNIQGNSLTYEFWDGTNRVSIDLSKLKEVKKK